MPKSSTSRSEAGSLGAYDKRLDPEIRAFVARSSAWYPPETLTLPLERQRAIYSTMCQAFHCGTPAGVGSTDGAIDLQDRSLCIRRYSLAGHQPEATILYYHGGGFVLGGLDSHDDVCAALCDGTGYEVISVDYRLAPEHRHPAQFEDACALFDWAAQTLDRPLLLCGESAGGNLAAAVAHARRHHVRATIGQVLIYPSLAGRNEGRSYREHAEAPMLAACAMDDYRRHRFGDVPPSNDPTAAPLDDTDFSGLPPTVIVTAECDPLSSDGEAYRDRIRAAGGKAHWDEAIGLVHSFMRARKSSTRAQSACDRIVAALAALGRRDWPY
ncbi:alpha/beta hydrolase [Dongia sedimenti]|uniref:Alpha/beta hydrolase n=1 Tax=Dongia sedimenti TaxID=3064282 RepID=A0ABU0YU94_9PROT|nr:alpha/beta hydrolase [Rhodospirillaceae bacterium R-7]